MVAIFYNTNDFYFICVLATPDDPDGGLSVAIIIVIILIIIILIICVIIYILYRR